MAAPKKYKTNTLKKSSTKKSPSRKAVAQKGFTSRVGLTKLSRKSFLKPWMAIPALLLVALAGYMVVQFSDASSGLALHVVSSSCRATTKSDGRNANQCLSGQAIKYAAKAEPGNYKVCYQLAASHGSAWKIGIEGNRAIGGSGTLFPEKTSTGSENSASSNKYGVASRFVCSPSITNAGGGSVSSVLTTTANGKNNNAQYYGVYVYGAKLVGASSNTNYNADNRQEARVACNAKPDYVNTRNIPNGAKQIKYGYRWDGKNCVSYYIATLNVSCNAGFTQRGTSCRPTPRPVVVRCDNSNETKRNNQCVPKYDNATSVNCPAGYSGMTVPYANRSKYRCQKRIHQEFEFSKPTPLSCSFNYRVANVSDKWQICIRKSNR